VKHGIEQLHVHNINLTTSRNELSYWSELKRRLFFELRLLRKRGPYFRVLTNKYERDDYDETPSELNDTFNL
jgi:hypothetical protein